MRQRSELICWNKRGRFKINPCGRGKGILTPHHMDLLYIIGAIIAELNIELNDTR